MFLMYRLQRLEGLGDMFLRGELREEDVADNALSVDDVRHASRQPECCGHSVALSNYAPYITQQDERQPVCCGELLVRLHRV